MAKRFWLVLFFWLALTAGTSGTPARASGGTQAGWDMPRLEAAFRLAATMGTSTLMVVTDGRPVRTMGDIRKPHRVHSVRKALLSALVGQHAGAGKGKINLNHTLAQLEIDDAPVPLTKLQKQAKVLHLIKSVSGINHAAAAETGAMTADKQKQLGFRPNPPGAVWAYNNWDYNALTTIFEQETGRRVCDAFLWGIARPLGMQDVTAQSVFYSRDKALSVHPKAGFKLSARDMARFGQLYLDQGRFDGRQIVPAAWVRRITTDFTRTGRKGLGSGHGYLWWVPCDAASKKMGVPGGTFLASGFAGQKIVVVPAWRTVIVHQVSTDDYNGFCSRWIKSRGLDLDAAVDYSREKCRQPRYAQIEFCRRCRYFSGADFERLLVEIIRARSAPEGNSQKPAAKP